METLPLHGANNDRLRRRRIGRPHSKIQKVAISVRIPADLDAYLTHYTDEHGVLKGDVIAEAVMLFRLNKAREQAPQQRAASHA